jgi:hypothetical protein
MPKTNTVEKPQEIFQIKVTLLGMDRRSGGDCWFPQT